MIKIGDTVSVIDEAINGVVKVIKAQTITIEDDDGFLHNFNAKELIKTDARLYQKHLFPTQIVQAISEKDSAVIKKSIVKEKSKHEPIYEVDLHIQHLVKSTRGLTNYEILSVQLNTVKRQLEFAMLKRIQKIVFIHGVGEGVLKTELEYLFNKYDNLTYYDANFQKYGLGATEVYIYQNPK